MAVCPLNLGVHGEVHGFIASIREMRFSCAFHVRSEASTHIHQPEATSTHPHQLVRPPRPQNNPFQPRPDKTAAVDRVPVPHPTGPTKTTTRPVSSQEARRCRAPTHGTAASARRAPSRPPWAVPRLGGGARCCGTVAVKCWLDAGLGGKRVKERQNVWKKSRRTGRLSESEGVCVCVTPCI